MPRQQYVVFLSGGESTRSGVRLISLTHLVDKSLVFPVLVNDGLPPEDIEGARRLCHELGVRQPLVLKSRCLPALSRASSDPALSSLRRSYYLLMYCSHFYESPSPWEVFCWGNAPDETYAPLPKKERASLARRGPLGLDGGVPCAS